ncbi:MAG: replicative DNA helicase [Deltaproteobacteria bacterium]|nr:replicative DNA helicase [Deltaproteobacteria bacterium]
MAQPVETKESLRAIPVDHEAERAVLGAILLDHNSLFKIEDKVNASSFDLPRHRILYDACLSLASKQQAITLITLRSFLEEQGVLDEVGGVGFLGGLVDATPTAAHVEHHADIVREKALARSLIRTCERIASRGYEGSTSVADLIQEAELEVLQISMGHAESGFSGVKAELQGAFEYIEKVQSGEVTGVRMGFHDLDQKIGGLQGGDLAVIASRPSMGKTALALNISRNHARDQGGCVGIFSLEMTRRQLVVRLLMSEAEVDFSRFRGGVLGDRDMRALTRAASQLEDARIFVDDSALLTVSDIAAKARRLDREEKLTLIIVDYIQLIQGRKRDERREQEVAEISRSLKLLAKELNLPVIALSQLNRGPEMRPNKRPMLADLRESGAIEQDADVVMFIYRDEVYDENTPDLGIAEVNIAKQRNGPIGTVRLQFEGRYTRFSDLSAREDVPPVTAGFDPEEPLF